MTRVRVRGIKRYRSRGAGMSITGKRESALKPSMGRRSFSMNSRYSNDASNVKQPSLARSVDCSPPTAHHALILIWRQRHVPVTHG